MGREILGMIAVAALVAACGGDATGPTPLPCTVSAVTITNAPIDLDVGDVILLHADVTSVNCGNGPPVTWSTSNEEMATVSGSGTLTALSAGPVVVAATAGGKSGAAHITILPVH